MVRARQTAVQISAVHPKTASEKYRNYSLLLNEKYIKITYLIKGRNGAEHETFTQRKETEQDNVQRPASAEVVTASQDDQKDKCHGESDPPHLGMLTRVHFDIWLVDE